MSWFFAKIFSNYDIDLSESRTDKKAQSFYYQYDSNGNLNKNYKLVPDPLYCFMDKKNAFINSEFGKRDFIKVYENIFLVSKKVFDVINSAKINYKKSDVEIVNREKYNIKDDYYAITLSDVYDNSLDPEKSGIKYGIEEGNKYIASVDRFIFRSDIDVDLFIPMDSTTFHIAVCSENFKDKLIEAGVTDVRFDLVDDFVAVHDPVLSFPDVLKIIPRPRSADYYLERRLKKKGKK